MTRATPATILLAAALASPSIAQSEAKPPADILSGPKVEDRSVPGAPSQFGESMDPRLRAERVPLEVFLRAVRALGDDPTPPETRLTPDQLEQIHAAQQEHQKAQREFMREHMDEIRQLREQTGARNNNRGGAPQRPAADPNLTPEERAKLLQRLQELQQARPSTDAAMTRIYAALTPAQQTIVRAEIDAWADQQLEQRAMQRLHALKAERTAEGETPQRRAAADRFAAEHGVAPEKLEQIRAALAAPATDAEKALPFAERIARRVDALPPDLATPAQKDALKALLLERGKQRS